MSAEIKTEEQWEKEGLGIAGRQVVYSSEDILRDDLIIESSGTRWRARYNFSVRVYRRIPVPKQGDCDGSLEDSSRQSALLDKLNDSLRNLEKDAIESYRKNVPPFDERAKASLPTDAAARKKLPVFSGVLQYFPDAILSVAHCSYVGNEQHNPGQPLHWDRTKSMDHPDCEIRHLMQRGTRDSDGVRHSAKRAWRALADLQLEIENDTDKSP